MSKSNQNINESQQANSDGYSDLLDPFRSTLCSQNGDDTSFSRLGIFSRHTTDTSLPTSEVEFLHWLDMCDGTRRSLLEDMDRKLLPDYPLEDLLRRWQDLRRQHPAILRWEINRNKLDYDDVTLCLLDWSYRAWLYFLSNAESMHTKEGTQ